MNSQVQYCLATESFREVYREDREEAALLQNTLWGNWSSHMGAAKYTEKQSPYDTSEETWLEWHRTWH